MTSASVASCSVMPAQHCQLACTVCCEHGPTPAKIDRHECETSLFAEHAQFGEVLLGQNLALLLHAAKGRREEDTAAAC